MRNEQTPYSLEQALPAQVVAHRYLLFLGYRRFPVFSRPWLLRRTLLFSAILAIYASMVMLGDGFSGTGLRDVLLSGLVFFIGCFLMFATGPLLATLVRHARMPLRRERIAVVLAVLIGMFASFFADTWASGYLERNDSPAHREKKLIHRPGLSEVQKAGILTFNLMLLASIYGAFGGGLALRAYFGELRRWRTNRDAETMVEMQAQKQQTDLRLGVLQAQVEPHFLFNTLASVRALVRQSPERAEATLDALVDYCAPAFRGCATAKRRCIPHSVSNWRCASVIWS
jgi:Histidine kinase